MKYIILVLTLVGLPLLSAATAENFSCRDSGGRLHVADNLMSLPEECRSQAETNEYTDSGKVNYVPPAVQSGQGSNDFDRALREEQRTIKQQKSEAESLVSQANNLASSYEDAVITRKSALRSKKYGFRETIILADQQMQRARATKRVLLEKLTRARLTTAQREQIIMLLDRIED